MFDPTQFYLQNVAQQQNLFSNTLQNFNTQQQDLQQTRALQNFGNAQVAQLIRLAAAKKRAQQIAAANGTPENGQNILGQLATLIGAGLGHLF